MKNLKQKIGGLVASIALKVTAMDANVTCTFLHHQPKLPKGAAKLRKF